MANNERCKYCGYYEPDHYYRDDVDNPEKKLHGFKVSIMECEGFKRKESLDDSNKELDHFKLEVYERRAQERAAWGTFVTYSRNEQCKDAIRKFDERLRLAGTSSDREKIQREKSAYIASRLNLPSIHVG